LASIHEPAFRERDLAFLERMEAYELAKTDAEKIAVVRSALDEIAVKYEVVTKRGLLFFSKTYIRILPEGYSALNRLARNIGERYSATLSFEPLIAGYSAFYVSSEKRIALPVGAVMSGEMGLVTLHELRHMALNQRNLDGRTPLFNGLMMKIPGTDWPWGKSSHQGYANAMYIEEISTWGQGAEYVIRRDLAKYRSLNFMLSFDTTLREAKLLLEDALKLVRYERQMLSAGKLLLDRNRKGKATMSLVGWTYMISQTIPERLFAGQPEALEPAAARYIEAMEGRIARKLERIERYIKLEDELDAEIDRLVKAWAAQKPSSGLDGFLRSDFAMYPPGLKQQIADAVERLTESHGF
jgi:hypothetical protein